MSPRRPETPDPLLQSALASYGIERLFLERGPAGGCTPGVEPGAGGPGEGESLSVREELDELYESVGDCTGCGLSSSRNRIVLGEGNPGAGVLFVGEGPGRTEDETGRPFVGRAGRLLDRILEAIDLNREKAYITNVVKCRPPNNRTPTDAEIAACYWILEEQVRIMRPGVICALGAPAARTLTGMKRGIGQLRGTVHRAFGDIPVVVTYHPAALLRSPALKRPVWEDMKALRRMMHDSGLPRRG